MGNLYLSPKGRIGSATFQKAAIILIAIGFLLSVITVLSPGLATIVGLLSFVLLWPWICVWIKRLHDAGKSGWMFLLVLLVFLVVSTIANQVVYSFLGIDQMAAIKAAIGGDTALATELTEKAKAATLPVSIVSAIVSFAYIFIINKMLKSDPEENQFGAATN